MQYIKQIMLLVILTISWKCQAEEVKEIWLDELGESSYYIQDWGLPRINKAVTMTPLTVKGIVYERGIGTHAISRMLFDIGKKAKTLSGLAGADDNTPFACNLQFKILRTMEKRNYEKRRSCQTFQYRFIRNRQSFIIGRGMRRWNDVRPR